MTQAPWTVVRKPPISQGAEHAPSFTIGGLGERTVSQKETFLEYSLGSRAMEMVVSISRYLSSVHDIDGQKSSGPELGFPVLAKLVQAPTMNLLMNLSVSVTRGDSPSGLKM